MLPHERVQLLLDHRVIGQLDRTEHDERVVLEDLDLRPLMPVLHVLDRQRVQAERLLHDRQVVVRGIDRVEPQERIVARQHRGRVGRVHLLVRDLPIDEDVRRDHRAEPSRWLV